MFLLDVHNWGWINSALTYENKVRMTYATLRLVYYGDGYFHPFSNTRILLWNRVVIDQMKIYVDLSFTPRNSSSKNYIILVDGCHYSYFHELYLYSTRTAGTEAILVTIAISIKNKTESIGKCCTSIDIS